MLVQQLGLFLLTEFALHELSHDEVLRTIETGQQSVWQLLLQLELLHESALALKEYKEQSNSSSRNVRIFTPFFDWHEFFIYQAIYGELAH